MDKLIASDQNQLRLYFEKIFQLHESGESFPSNIDEVWPLVYERRDYALRILRSEFIESEDYNLLQNEKVVKDNNLINGIKIDCVLSVPCLEYLIARKVRAVFEVYRSVFHKKINFEVPKTFADALQLAANQAKKIEIQTRQIEELAPKASVYDRISDTTNLKSMNDVAKVLGFGRNTLFEILRKRHILMENNLPYQTYITQGYFEVKTRPIPGINKDQSTTYVTGKGEVWLAKLLNIPVLILNN